MNTTLVDFLWDLLPLLVPILLIQLGMVVYSLIDLSRRTVTRGPRWAWALALIVFAVALPTGIIAAALYLMVGRNVEESYDTD